MSGAVTYRGLHGEAFRVRSVYRMGQGRFPLAGFAASLPSEEQRTRFAFFAQLRSYEECSAHVECQERRSASGLPVLCTPPRQGL